jgi:hypothetical protein
MNFAAARRSFEGPPPGFPFRGLRLTSDGGPVEFPLRGASEPVEPNHSTIVLETEPPPCVPSGADLAALRADIDRLKRRAEDARNGVGDRGGLALTVRMQRLMARHNLAYANPKPVDLLPEINAPAIRIRAIGATSALDLGRTYFSPQCRWAPFDISRIKILVGHDEKRGPVGRLIDLSFDEHGRLVLVADVFDRDAMTFPW